jgi:hypothetical protein
MANEVDTAVEYIFSRMAATYGSSWERAMGQSPAADIKTAWASAIGVYLHSTAAKQSIVWALDNLPDRCPNPREFKTLCGHAPALVVAALPSPKANPERMAAEISKLGSIKGASPSPHGMRAWAYSLKAQHEAGRSLNSNQISNYRAALGIAA